MAVRSKRKPRATQKPTGGGARKTPKYYRKAIMFGSLDKGGHLQVYEIYDEDKKKLDIKETAIQTSSKEPWKVAFTHKGNDYTTLKEALKARVIK